MLSEKSDVSSGVEGTDDSISANDPLREDDRLDELKLCLRVGDSCLEVEMGILEAAFCGVGDFTTGDDWRKGEEEPEPEDFREEEEAACLKNLIFISSTASSFVAGLPVYWAESSRSGLEKRSYIFCAGLPFMTGLVCLS